MPGPFQLDGEPIPRVSVFAFQDAAHKLLALPGPGVHRGNAETDDEGRFTIDGLATGEYTVQAERGGYKAANASIRGVRTDTEDVALSLVALARVQLAVVDRESGAPIEKFTVSISPQEKNTHLRERVDVVSPAGGYGFAALPGERYQIDVVAAGHDVYVVMVGPLDTGEIKLLRIPLVPK